MKPIRELITPIYHNLYTESMGLSTGFSELDHIIRGLLPSTFVIIAGRPSIGKTSLLVDMALVTAQQVDVGFISIEMGMVSIIEKMIANVARVNYVKMKLNALAEIERKKVDAAVTELQQYKLFVSDDSFLTVAQLEEYLKQTPIKCLFIDYIQLISAKAESRQQEVTSISKGLKALAKEFQIPIVAACQLNRAVEAREGGRPRLSDLRESGSLEQDADVVIFPFRRTYQKQEEDSLYGIGDAELIIAKHRMGATGVIPMTWQNDLASFRIIGEEF